jgi:plastocyanin
MSRSRRPAALLLATLIAASTALVATPPAGAEESPVSIKNFAYVPGNRQVNAGDTVTWTNDEAMVPHDVKAIVRHDVNTGISGQPDSVLPFESPLLKPGESFSFTFSVPGVHQYYCSLHPAMLGTVTVLAGATGTLDPEAGGGTSDVMSAGDTSE